MKKNRKGRPVFDRKTPHRRIFDERGVSPVIATILMVAITVVLSATLYVMVIGIVPPGGGTPTGAMTFAETDTENGVYTGSLIQISKQVKSSDVSVTIIDVNTNNSAILDPLSDGGYASCGEGELSITYKDLNSDGKFDPTDVFTIHNGESGDIIKLTYTKGSSGQICLVKLS